MKDSMTRSLRVLSAAVLLVSAVLISVPAAAADDATTDVEGAAPDVPLAKTKKPTGPKVLDFEADVIEGERKAPNLFLQLETDNPDLDTLMYRRNTFNDYHERERSRRPVYRKPAP